jgi:FkbM family methyltransferase
MSQYLMYIKDYSARYKVKKFTKVALIALWPIIKLYVWQNSRFNFIAKLSTNLFKLFKNFSFKHKVYAKDGTPVTMKIEFKKDDLIGFKEIFWENEYLAPFDISEIKTIVDCGANKGRASLFFMMNANVERVLLVEANPYLKESIEETLFSLSKKVEININNSCVTGKSSQNISFAVSEDTRNSHISQSKDSQNKNLNIKSISLRDLLKKYNFTGSIDLLKMDIEGSEFDVLENDLEIFKRFKYLCMEIHGKPEKRKYFFDKIKSIGFSVFEHPDRPSNMYSGFEILFAVNQS